VTPPLTAASRLREAEISAKGSLFEGAVGVADWGSFYYFRFHIIYYIMLQWILQAFFEFA
jgi:hypothetical protein